MSTLTRQRFLAKIDGNTNCWKWIGGKDRHGYGLVKIAGSMKLTHRVAYANFVGPIPAGMHVLHTCDNPGCVNPTHLWLGTHQDNMDDMARKGRANRCGPTSKQEPNQ